MKAKRYAPRAGTQHVQIGQIGVSEDGVLKATLGSCVGIALVCRKPRRYGLAHCLLPEAAAGEECGNARYASHAVRNLLAAMGLEDQEAHPRRFVRAYLAGGARVIGEAPVGGRRHIGELNLEAARRALAAESIHYDELDTGGELGCNIELDCTAHAVKSWRLKPLEVAE